jgi:type III secretory pathway component EscT
MKNKELKTLWKVAKRFWISGTIFWVLETIIFLIYEGWHLKATNPIEKWCDKIVSGMWTSALWMTIYICIGYLINLNKKRSN